MRFNKTVRAPIIILVCSFLTFAAFHDAKAQTGSGSGAGSDTSLSDVKRKGKLVVGVDIPYGVMEYLDELGKPTGIDMDIANEIASAIGVSWEVRMMPFKDLFGSLKGGEMDVVISAVTITPGRQKTMLFSVPYLDAGLTIAVRENNRSIRSTEDLRGKKVGVLKGTTGEELVRKSEYTDPSLIISYERNDERVKDLLDGKLDAIIVHFLVKEQPKIRIVGTPLTQAFYGVVAKLNDKALIGKINVVLRRLKRSGKINEIKQKYLGITQ